MRYHPFNIARARTRSEAWLKQEDIIQNMNSFRWEMREGLTQEKGSRIYEDILPQPEELDKKEEIARE